MADIKRVLSSVLLGLGVLLVFLGMSAALDFTAGGIVASIAAIGALLYAGAVWFAPPPRRAPAATIAAPIVFDVHRRILTGPSAGQPLPSQFPVEVRAELEQRCLAALGGVSVRFTSTLHGRTQHFDIVPVRRADGAVIYGILVCADAVPATVMAASA